MSRLSPRSLGVLVAAGAASLGPALVPAALAAASPVTGPGGSAGLTATVVLSGSSLSHTFTVDGTTKSEHLSSPDDITLLGNDIFVGFQNGVGPQGQPSTSGNLDSTVVEMTLFGKEAAQWDVQGKTDGVTADPDTGFVIATVNEDANSSLYTITPIAASAAGAVHHYSYNEPLPHDGGTDAISVLNGHLIISASAPGTTGTLPAPNQDVPGGVLGEPRLRALDRHRPCRSSTTRTPPVVANVERAELRPQRPAGADRPRLERDRAGRTGHASAATSCSPARATRSRSSCNPTGIPTTSRCSASRSPSTTRPGPTRHGRALRDGLDQRQRRRRDRGRSRRPDRRRDAVRRQQRAGDLSGAAHVPANYLASLNAWTGQVTPLPVGGAAVRAPGRAPLPPVAERGGQDQQ